MSTKEAEGADIASLQPSTCALPARAYAAGISVTVCPGSSGGSCAQDAVLSCALGHGASPDSCPGPQPLPDLPVTLSSLEFQVRFLHTLCAQLPCMSPAVPGEPMMFPADSPLGAAMVLPGNPSQTLSAVILNTTPRHFGREA